jgi:hypothetical protein
VLIRPDGYVAAVIGTADLATIETYLDAVGIHPPALTRPDDKEASSAVPTPSGARDESSVL